MANYSGQARSNYFHVKDEAAFRAVVARTDLGIFEGDADTPTEGMLALHCQNTDNGLWPSLIETEGGDVTEFDLVDFLRKHLADGQVAVLIEIGSEKMRYVSGTAFAFDNSDHPGVQITLDNIYDEAKAAFGVENVTQASY